MGSAAGAGVPAVPDAGPPRAGKGSAGGRLGRMIVAASIATAPGGCLGRPAPGIAPSPNRPPFVRIDCHPCSVAPGQEVRLTAVASDADGHPLTFRWTAADGAFIPPVEGAAVTWTAPPHPGPVPVAVTVSDGRGGAASDSATLAVSAAR